MICTSLQFISPFSKDFHKSIDRDLPSKDSKQNLKKLPQEDFSAKWREILAYNLASLLSLASLYSNYQYGNFVIIIWLFYVLVPILDCIFPLDNENLSSE